jgi:hypothetical protein
MPFVVFFAELHVEERGQEPTARATEDKKV